MKTIVTFTTNFAIRHLNIEVSDLNLSVSEELGRVIRDSLLCAIGRMRFEPGKAYRASSAMVLTVKTDLGNDVPEWFIIRVHVQADPGATNVVAEFEPQTAQTTGTVYSVPQHDLGLFGLRLGLISLKFKAEDGSCPEVADPVWFASRVTRRDRRERYDVPGGDVGQALAGMGGYLLTHKHSSVCDEYDLRSLHPSLRRMARKGLGLLYLLFLQYGKTFGTSRYSTYECRGGLTVSGPSHRDRTSRLLADNDALIALGLAVTAGFPAKLTGKSVTIVVPTQQGAVQISWQWDKSRDDDITTGLSDVPVVVTGDAGGLELFGVYNMPGGLKGAIRKIARKIGADKYNPGFGLFAHSVANLLLK